MCEFALIHVSDVLAIDNDLSAIRLEETDGKRQRYRFSSTARPQNGKCLAVSDPKRNTI